MGYVQALLGFDGMSWRVLEECEHVWAYTVHETARLGRFRIWMLYI